ncbi:type 1 glutamine amidotransferase domain-containing protein [Wenzhouxiangella marina]|uniref:DJ-1/PfpI family protein n=1 Tax=Wenzhouxiangella marina TaxID=1579979 RepID=A0A0K0XUH2_9GAMM|nr:type 1 glutamine amidotransferase domain-containing protein [Wenzhouxiangella marina]AKS41266.1 DJ-1/PfpI family protein [Wenzhouxiangella marina]MBB6086984.1 putative intracellular protease/amidase [Wenzhouxiangella marina]
MNALNAMLATALLLAAAGVDADEPQKVLIVVSNQVDMGDPEQHDARNDLFEVAPPFHVFLSHGYEVDFVSPDGGPVFFMRDPLGISSYAIAYEGFLERTEATLSPEQVDPEAYWGVFIGGGYGVMFDVAADEETQALIAGIHEAGGILGASGHGSAGFANVRLSTGAYLVDGKRIAGFPDSTETTKDWAEQGTLLPFLLETRLNEHGAIALNKESLDDQNEVVIDQRIVTTMFLPSAALVAKEMILLHEQDGARPDE